MFSNVHGYDTGSPKRRGGWGSGRRGRDGLKPRSGDTGGFVGPSKATPTSTNIANDNIFIIIILEFNIFLLMELITF